MLECVRQNSCVTITGSSGVGKSATLQHVVLKMADEGYDALLVTSPCDIVKFYHPNQKTLFIMDDFCGTYSINQTDLGNWEPVIERVKELIQNKLTKIIVACRLQVYKDERFKSLSIFRHNVCNLLSEDLCLTQTEQKSIAEIYMKTKVSKIIQYSALYDCFPLLCKLYHDNPGLSITDFFQNPFTVYETEIEKLKESKSFGKYCALALCVMFNNRLKEEVLTTGYLHKKTKIIIKNTCEACRLERSTSRLTLLDELDTLEHTFIKKENGIYRTLHDRLYDFLFYYFGKKMMQCLIKNAHTLCIKERFLLQIEADMDQFISIVPPTYHQIYIQRMIDDWTNGELQDTFDNINMKKTMFRQRILSYLNTLDISNQTKLAQIRDIDSKSTVLIHCCNAIDIPLIQWCCNHGVDVNLCRIDGLSPIYIASEKGDYEVVKILLDNKADTNKTWTYDISPLYIACEKGYTNIVKLLLENKAEINKCKTNETSPLYMACAKGYTNIVQLLLENKANTNICRKHEHSPLYMACYKGHKDIVKLLLDNNADINKCDTRAASPLFIACEKGHIDIIQLLLNNKADINSCKNDGTSPLYMACYKGYTDIVKLLLKNKADTNKCKNHELSPLYMACYQGHTDIVELLLDNSEYKDVCSNKETAPLFIARKKEYTDIVKLLLEKKTDNNKCNKK